MSNISLDKNLVPGQEVEILLRMTIFGEEVEDTIKIPVPQAPPLVNKLKDIKLKIENRDKYVVGNNKTFNFNKFKKFTTELSKTRYKFLMVLTNPKAVGDLAADDDIIINCAEAGFTNVQGVVLPGNSKKKNYVYASISKNNLPLKNLDTNTSGTIQEYKKKIKIRDVTVELPDSLIKSLVSEKPTPSPQKGNVQDIVIFIFKQFSGPNKSSIKYKIMDGDEKVIDLKNPPPRSDVVEFIGKKSHKKSFILNDEKGEKILCYIAIARYINNGTGWSGEWLQTNESNNVIFGRAE
jgi:hypothetical protein